MYRDTKIVNVNSVRGKLQEYFSTTLDYTTKGEVEIDMQKYLK